MGDGNINVFSRPRSVNPDGSISTLFSMRDGDPKSQVLFPGVDEHGKGQLSGDVAHDQYENTGHFLGKGPAPKLEMLENFLHHEAASGLTTPPLATSRQSIDPEHLNQVLLYLLTRGK